MNKHSPMISFTVGSASRSVTADPARRLSEVLRDDLNLKSVKIGCDAGDCGACTIALRELGPRGRLTQRTVNACIHLLPMVHGKEVVTVEHLTRDGDLHPVQKAMSEGHGSQCGFCTPGMIMTSVDMVNRYKAEGKDLTSAAIRNELEGNICRCTGYHNIVKSVEDAAAKM